MKKVHNHEAPVIVNKDFTTTCCGAYTTIFIDDGMEYCKCCYRNVEGHIVGFDFDDAYEPSPGVPDFGMFSDDGNRAVAVAVATAKLLNGLVEVADVQQAVYDAGHKEVTDTAVREYIQEALATTKENQS